MTSQKLMLECRGLLWLLTPRRPAHCGLDGVMYERFLSPWIGRTQNNACIWLLHGVNVGWLLCMASDEATRVSVADG
jgi:hypothetical protein